jgi:hypothetical protein
MKFVYSNEEFDFEEDVDLDAKMVLAAMSGMFAPCAMVLGFKSPAEAFGRAQWMKQQPEAYITKVCERAAELENGARKA